MAQSKVIPLPDHEKVIINGLDLPLIVDFSDPDDLIYNWADVGAGYRVNVKTYARIRQDAIVLHMSQDLSIKIHDILFAKGVHNSSPHAWIAITSDYQVSVYEACRMNGRSYQHCDLIGFESAQDAVAMKLRLP